MMKSQTKLTETTDIDLLFSENENEFEKENLRKPSHREYEKDFEIIENKEQFDEKIISHKYKIAWLNDRGRLCLRSFILLGHDRENRENYVSIDVIKGIKNDEIKIIKHYSEIFNDNNLVFAGYLPDDVIISKLNHKKKLNA